MQANTDEPDVSFSKKREGEESKSPPEALSPSCRPVATNMLTEPHAGEVECRPDRIAQTGGMNTDGHLHLFSHTTLLLGRHSRYENPFLFQTNRISNIFLGQFTTVRCSN